MAQPATQLTATEAMIAELQMPDTGWSKAARADALGRLRAMGLPERRDEYWKYTRPDTLIAPVAPKAAVFDNDEKPLFDDVDRLKIVFVDGVFDADASDDLTGEGLTIERLATATSDLRQTVRRLLHARLPR
jgi:Fe-S cluster assembly protein SufD